MWRRTFLLGGFALSLTAVTGSSWARAVAPSVLLEGLAQRLFERECGGRRDRLVWWSPHEPFPSLGIGHFIWVPEEVSVPFEAVFPEMVTWVSARTTPAPAWARQPHPPWPDRSAFLQEGDSSRIRALREWLWQTRKAQAAFVIHRFRRRLQRALTSLPAAQRRHVVRQYRLLAQSPEGLWAMLDYFNFKGMGDQPRERYQGQGWGLLQVLTAMPASVREETALPTFVEAARYVLHKRIRLSPPERNEARWWPGWSKRLEGYLP